MLEHAPPSPAVCEADRDRAASEFLENALRARDAGGGWFLRHPLESLRGLRLLHTLPIVRARLGRDGESDAVRRGLRRGDHVRRMLIGGATAVLCLPIDADTYLLGSSKQTLRRKIRAAERMGVTWRPVFNAAERQGLIALLDDSERTNVRSAYRHENPENDDLFEADQWLAAFAPDGRPVLLSVTPIDGEWAVLRTFRALEDSDESSAARYLMSSVLAQHLIARGVRYLADTQSPASLPPGLRFFQRLLGYRLMRVRLH